MAETPTIDQQRFMCDSYCAHGPIFQLFAIGGLSALVLPPLYKMIISTLISPVSIGHPYISPDAVHPVSLYVFMFTGIIGALLSRTHRRLRSIRHRWSIPWEAVAGTCAYAAITWYIFKGALAPQAANSYYSMVWFLPLGFLAYKIWRAAFRLGVHVIMDISWKDTAQAVSHHFARHIGIPPERVFLVAADERGYSLLVRGSFSATETARLRMGLLMNLGYVAQLDVLSSRSTTRADFNDLSEYKLLARLRRDAAIARLHRQKVSYGEQESLPLPWNERLLQLKYAGPLIVSIAVIWAAIVGFVLWLAGVFQPIKSSDLESFFDAPASPKVTVTTDQ